MQNNSSTIEKLKQVINVLQSRHIQSVEIGFEYSDGDTNYYTAVTEKVNARGDSFAIEQHRYRVRSEKKFNASTGENELEIKCNCAGFARRAYCRHVLKVAEVEAEEFNRGLSLDVFSGYRAHQRYQKTF